MLEEFFAVTTHVGENESKRTKSLYRISTELNHNNQPTVEKLACSGPTDMPVGRQLENGYYVAITDLYGIALYRFARSENRPPNPNRVSTKSYGGSTSPIVGLFRDKKSGQKCFKQKGLQKLDKRWMPETLMIFAAIGTDHPVFILDEIFEEMARNITTANSHQLDKLSLR